MYMQSGKANWCDVRIVVIAQNIMTEMAIRIGCVMNGMVEQMLMDSVIVGNAKAVVMNERKTNYCQWWSWIRWFIDYRIYSVEIVRYYYVELGVGAFSHMDRSYPRYFIIGDANYFGKAIKTNDK